MKRKAILLSLAAVLVANFSTVSASAAISDENLDAAKNKVTDYFTNWSAQNEQADEVRTAIYPTEETEQYENTALTNDLFNFEEVDIDLSLPEFDFSDLGNGELDFGNLGNDGDEERGVAPKFLFIDNILKIVHVGDTYTITATVKPDCTEDKTVIFTSSNPEVATVDENGNVVAVAVGETTIIVSTADGSERKVAKVKVKEKVSIELPEVEWPEVEWPEVEWPEIEWPSVSWPSVSWPSVSWPTTGTTGSTTKITPTGGTASKIQATNTSANKSYSTLPNTGSALPIDIVGIASILSGLVIYKKRK